jgi:hypothetical protein
VDKEAARERHRELSEEGWEWRFSGDLHRVAYLEDNYAALGMETRVEPGVLGVDTNCRACFDVRGPGPEYVTLYTRGQARTTGRFDDDLFLD